MGGPAVGDRPPNLNRDLGRLAEFEPLDVLGATDFTFTLTAHAKSRGWDAAFGARDVAVTNGQSGRETPIHSGGSDAIEACAGWSGFPRR